MATMHDKLKLVSNAYELDNYRDEPKQMRSAAPGKVGELKLTFTKSGDRSVLSHLYRVVPLLVQKALYWDNEMPELPICSMISVGGGVLQGDRYHIDINVEEGACAHVTSQGANRIHQMDANYAAQYQSITVGPEGYLEFMPDFTILYKDSRYISQTDIVISPGASLLYSEMVMLGRLHHQEERMEFDLLSLLTRVKTPDGKNLFTEKILLEPESDFPEKVGEIIGFNVFANVICLTSKEHADEIRREYKAFFAEDKSVYASISNLPNSAGIMLRVVGTESYLVRDQVTQFWRVCRKAIKKRDLPRKFVWN
ncbi:urease accessory protein UreD [Vibrio alfacsensis]|uniref:urease accessory protein UreD n=1 Tax=Vibrio alfacsensis TaxID=1074311 RepID=UPI004068EF87